MEIPKITNPFKKKVEKDSPAVAPVSSEDENTSIDEDIETIESAGVASEENETTDNATGKTPLQSEVPKEVSIQDILENFELRIQRIEYHNRLM